MPNQFVLILLLLLFILSVHFRIMIRAHLFSILFFTLFLFLVDRYRTGKHRLSLLVTFNNAILVQFPFRISLWFWIARPCCLGRFSSIPVYKTSFFSAITPQTTVSSLYVSCLSLFNYQFYQSAGTLLAGAHDYSLRHWRSYSACWIPAFMGITTNYITIFLSGNYLSNNHYHKNYCDPAFSAVWSGHTGILLFLLKAQSYNTLFFCYNNCIVYLFFNQPEKFSLY